MMFLLFLFTVLSTVSDNILVFATSFYEHKQQLENLDFSDFDHQESLGNHHYLSRQKERQLKKELQDLEHLKLLERLGLHKRIFKKNGKLKEKLKSREGRVRHNRGNSVGEIGDDVASKDSESYKDRDVLEI